MTFNKLKGRIVEKGYNQGVVAKKIGMTGKTLSLKLSGKANFTLKDIYKISSVLEIENPAEFFLNTSSQISNKNKEMLA